MFIFHVSPAITNTNCKLLFLPLVIDFAAGRVRIYVQNVYFYQKFLLQLSHEIVNFDFSHLLSKNSYPLRHCLVQLVRSNLLPESSSILWTFDQLPKDNTSLNLKYGNRKTYHLKSIIQNP